MRAGQPNWSDAPNFMRATAASISSGRFNFLASDTAAALIDCALLTKIHLSCVTLLSHPIHRDFKQPPKKRKRPDSG